MLARRSKQQVKYQLDWQVWDLDWNLAYRYLGTRYDVAIDPDRDLVSNRSSFELCRRFHTFNTRFVNVVVPIRMRIAADQVINIITITGDTPVDRSRQAFKAPFPLFTLLRFKALNRRRVNSGKGALKA